MIISIVILIDIFIIMTMFIVLNSTTQKIKSKNVSDELFYHIVWSQQAYVYRLIAHWPAVEQLSIIIIQLLYQ